MNKIKKEKLKIDKQSNKQLRVIKTNKIESQILKKISFINKNLTRSA
jgi:hypothetical protein